MKESEAGFYCPAYVGLRCVLLLMVLEGHYWVEAYPDSRVGSLSLSVPCFFALSGFLISHTLFAYESLPKGRALATFYARRALRILPAYYLVLGLAQLLKGVPCLVWHATYLFNFKIYLLSTRDLPAFYDFMAYRDFNAIHFWSVCVEEQFYLLYPLLIFATPRRWRTAILGGGIALSVLARLALRGDNPHAFFGGLPYVAGEYILWGCLLAWMDYRQRWTSLRSAWALYLSLAALLALGWYDDSFRRFAQWKPPAHQTVYCLLIAVFVLALRYNGASLVARALTWRPLQWAGTMSYGAYLVHSFLNPSVDRLTGAYPWLAPFPQCPRAVLGPVLTLAVAALLWYGWEKPIGRLRRRWSGSVKKVRVATHELRQSDQLQDEAEAGQRPE